MTDSDDVWVPILLHSDEIDRRRSAFDDGYRAGWEAAMRAVDRHSDECTKCGDCVEGLGVLVTTKPGEQEG